MRIVIVFALLSPACSHASDPAPAPSAEPQGALRCPQGATHQGGRPGFDLEYCEDGEKHRHGPYRYWFPNSAIVMEEGAYVHGHLQGPWTHRGEDGHVLQEGQYADGVRVGAWKSWHPSGKPESESSYDAQGQLEGMMLEWSVTGTFDATCYAQGKAQWHIADETKARAAKCPGPPP